MKILLFLLAIYILGMVWLNKWIQFTENKSQLLWQCGMTDH